MLVLSRREYDEIVIGERGPNEIRVVVLEILAGRVRLGVQAPKDVTVDRLEIRERKEQR